MPNYISNNFTEGSPEEVLKSFALREGLELKSFEFAKYMDEIDPLSSFRQRFSYPKKETLPHTDKTFVDSDSDECIYLCGNSLGLKPKAVDESVRQQLNKWSDMGVEQHFEDPLPAALCDEYGRNSMGRILGAEASSVVLMNSLTVNLHHLLISFYQPTQKRFKIIIEKNAFPSDRYAVRSQVLIRGFDPEEAVVEISARPGEHFVRTDDILQVIEAEGDETTVLCLSGVQYYTGQKFDMEMITKAGHLKGIYVGWDLAHAVGNVQLRLDEWEVDFACWCTYKYLNSGAGCIGGAYVNRKHRRRNVPHLQGWWSNKSETRFLMRENCDQAEGIDGFRLSNPSPILISCVLASLKVFDEAGMEAILKKQFRLTGYLEYLIDASLSEHLSDGKLAEIITPRNPEERGCQLSLVFSIPLHKVHEELQRRGVVCDVRKPHVMRVAPAPLYNSFTDVYNFVKILQDVLDQHK